MLKYKHIGITAKSKLDQKEEAVKGVVDILRKLDVDICVDSERLSHLKCAKDLMKMKAIEDIDLLIEDDFLTTALFCLSMYLSRDFIYLLI